MFFTYQSNINNITRNTKTKNFSPNIIVDNTNLDNRPTPSINVYCSGNSCFNDNITIDDSCTITLVPVTTTPTPTTTTTSPTTTSTTTEEPTTTSSPTTLAPTSTTPNP